MASTGRKAQIAQKPGHGPGASSDTHHESHDKEQVRAGGTTGFAYRLTRQVSAGSEVGANRAVWEQDDPTWLTTAMLGKLSYQYEQLTGTLGLGFQRENHDLAVPDDPLMRVGLQCAF